MVRYSLSNVKKNFSYQCRTLSTASITRFMSSLARLRVSARTDLDIFVVVNKLANFVATMMPL